MMHTVVQKTFPGVIMYINALMCNITKIKIKIKKKNPAVSFDIHYNALMCNITKIKIKLKKKKKKKKIENKIKKK